MNIVVNAILAIYIFWTILGLYLIADASVGLMQDGENHDH